MLNKIPNMLSSLRIILIPFLFIFLYNKKILLTLIIIGGLSDLVDGLIARRFKITSKKGAKLDSFADDLFITASFICLAIIFPEIFKENIIMIGLIILFYLTGLLLKLLIIKKMIFTHLYSHKITSWLGYFLIFYLIVIGYNRLLLTIIVILYILALIEEILIIIIRRHIDENTKSLFLK